MWLKEKKDKPLIEDVFEHDVILIPMGINNAIRNGFMYDVCLHFPTVKEEEAKTPYGDVRKYGTVCTVNVDGLYFCICYMVRQTNRKQDGVDFVDYDALESCLRIVDNRFKGEDIATPILGHGWLEGNGDKKRIVSLIKSTLKDAESVTIYDYEQKDYKFEIFKEIATLRRLLKEKVLTPDEYIKERSKVEWRRRYGIFKPYDENYIYIPRKGEKS